MSVETHWNLHLFIGPNSSSIDLLPRKPDRAVSPEENLNHYLIRPPNHADPSWLPTDQGKQSDPNAVHVQTLDNIGGENVLLIEVDDVQIVYVPEQWFATQVTAESITINLQEVEEPELLIIGSGELTHFADKGTGLLLKFIKPQNVFLSNTSPTDQPSIDSIRGHVGDDQFVLHDDHNTIALSNAKSDKPMQFIIVADRPWQMPNELSKLFQAMEEANSESQKVFEKLSVNQMNFKPANGTHTPRWNTEHMMGRQLLFFSQIYHAMDPTIPIMDLNPKQMPPDYEFTHPDWDGQEEARQMERVSQFTRRFAYLLDRIDLDKKAPGSRWTLRGLLRQMDSHYGQHTANTVKKFELPGWPEK